MAETMGFKSNPRKEQTLFCLKGGRHMLLQLLMLVILLLMLLRLLALMLSGCC